VLGVAMEAGILLNIGMTILLWDKWA
jgi:hypothetical protein